MTEEAEEALKLMERERERERERESINVCYDKATK